MTSDEVRGTVLAKLRTGSARPAILQALAARGLERGDAVRVYESVRAEWLRQELPARLRRLGRRHVLLGATFLAMGLLILAGVTWFYTTWFSEERGAPPLRFWMLGLIALGIPLTGGGELLYGFTRLKLARKAERGRLRAADLRHTDSGRGA